MLNKLTKGRLTGKEVYFVCTQGMSQTVVKTPNRTLDRGTSIHPTLTKVGKEKIRQRKRKSFELVRPCKLCEVD